MVTCQIEWKDGWLWFMNFNPHSKGTLVFLEKAIEPLENARKGVVVVHSESLDQ